jgi:hypothetical protein
VVGLMSPSSRSILLLTIMLLGLAKRIVLIMRRSTAGVPSQTPIILWQPSSSATVGGLGLQGAVYPSFVAEPTIPAGEADGATNNT